jgi:hypothetical protein
MVRYQSQNNGRDRAGVGRDPPAASTGTSGEALTVTLINYRTEKRIYLQLGCGTISRVDDQQRFPIFNPG